MSGERSLLPDILRAADGKIVGRIRMQKIVYLLEQMGMKSGFRFSYHHYGPYSEELASALDVARLFDGEINEEEERVDWGAYSVFTLADSNRPIPGKIGALDWEQVRSAITAMKAETSVVIELAATIHWLKHKENVDDWRTELKVRKPNKADNLRITKAETLLRTLNLAS